MPSTSLIYRRRFKADFQFRKKMWQALCRDYLQKFVPGEASVIDIGAGFCEFINNIRCAEKLAFDSNADIRDYADGNVKVIIGEASDMREVPSEIIDVAFVSNLFEHLTKENIEKSLLEIKRILKPGGILLILQPNIRYCFRDFWMFFDHITPLDDRSLAEVLEISGFTITECVPKFLPYTTKSSYPKSIFLFKLYLKFPLAQMILGQQAFISAEKPAGA